MRDKIVQHSNKRNKVRSLYVWPGVFSSALVFPHSKEDCCKFNQSPSLKMITKCPWQQKASSPFSLCSRHKAGLQFYPTIQGRNSWLSGLLPFRCRICSKGSPSQKLLREQPLSLHQKLAPLSTYIKISTKILDKNWNSWEEFGKRSPCLCFPL